MIGNRYITAFAGNLSLLNNLVKVAPLSVIKYFLNVARAPALHTVVDITGIFKQIQ
jgi:hypothetical protein